jgi:hypothetical protein
MWAVRIAVCPRGHQDDGEDITMKALKKTSQLLMSLLRHRIPVKDDRNMLFVWDLCGNRVIITIGCYKTVRNKLIVEARLNQKEHQKHSANHAQRWGENVKPETVVRWVLKTLKEKL